MTDAAPAPEAPAEPAPVEAPPALEPVVEAPAPVEPAPAPEPEKPSFLAEAVRLLVKAENETGLGAGGHFLAIADRYLALAKDAEKLV